MKKNKYRKPVFNEEVWTPYPVVTNRLISTTLHKVVIHDNLPLSEDPLMYDQPEISIDKYNKCRDPLMLIDAFLHAQHWNQYPPVWVLREMARIFSKRYDSAINLNVLFGFAKSGKGRGVPFSKKLDVKSEQSVMVNIFRLETYFRCLKKEAMDVAIKTTGHSLGDGTIKRKYSTWFKLFNSEVYKSSTEEWLKKNKKKFLSQFPTEDIEKLSEKYRLKMLRE